MICPKCGALAARSHTRTLLESWIKTISPFRFYRCIGCGWRGMLAGGKSQRHNQVIGAIYFWLVGGVLALIIAYAAS